MPYCGKDHAALSVVVAQARLHVTGAPFGVSLSKSGPENLRLLSLSRSLISNILKWLSHGYSPFVDLAMSSIVTSCNFGPDGRTVLSGSLNGHLKLWDIASGTVLSTLGSDDCGTGCMSGAFCPCGRIVMFGTGMSTLFDANGQPEKRSLDCGPLAPSGITFQVCCFSPGLL